jgi:hypothetical protein
MKLTKREIGVMQSALVTYINLLRSQRDKKGHSWNDDLPKIQSKIDISKNLLGKLEEILQ